MQDVTVFEVLGIEAGDAITVDNPWSNLGAREVIPLAFSRSGISIRAIDCRYGDICYVSAEWLIYMSSGETQKLKEFPYIAKNMNDFYSAKSKQREARRRNHSEVVEREFASINEVLDTVSLDSLKVAITGTLPLPRSDAKALFESKGAVVVGSVSRQTSFLIMGNTGRYEVTEKMKKAYDLGVKIIML